MPGSGSALGHSRRRRRFSLLLGLCLLAAAKQALQPGKHGPIIAEESVCAN
jgi:hypothetical protein